MNKKYFYRAVDPTVGDFRRRKIIPSIFCLQPNGIKRWLYVIFNKIICNNGQQSLVNIDKSGTNKAAINSYNEENNIRIEIRQ